MKLSSENRWRQAVATTIAAAVFTPILAVFLGGPSLAQDTRKSDSSSWERADSVLVVPPVYRPDTSLPADACAEDCPSSITPRTGDAPIAVAGSADSESNASAGTADNPRDESAAVGGYAPDGSASGGYAPDGSGLLGQQAAGNTPANPLGSVRDYDGQQAEAGQRGNYGAVQGPPVIIAVPAGSYAAAGTAAPAAPASAGASLPSSSFPSASWMPQPMARIAPLPPMVPRVVGGFSGSFPQTPGFGGGFGNR